MAVQRRLLQMQMQLLLATWSARIRYHGPRPVPAANRVIDSTPRVHPKHALCRIERRHGIRRIWPLGMRPKAACCDGCFTALPCHLLLIVRSRRADMARRALHAIDR